jgi:serine/threonine-protein kinase
VWRARDIVLDRDVAVKVLAADTNQPMLDAVRTEALAAARLSHPHIARVFDYGEEHTGTGQPIQFVVMELLEGQSLATVDLPMPPRQALRVCAEVAAALAAAHAQGVVHRDVKPGNVMLTPDGAKVFDFGLAARIGSPELDGRSDRIFGTPAYVAPERLAGATVGTAADVYALGVLLYRTLTGEHPWTASTPAELIAAHASGEPTPLPALEGVPEGIAEMYRRCLSRDPDGRPAAGEVAAALAAIVWGHDPGPQVRVAAPGGAPEPGTEPIGSRSPRRLVSVRWRRATFAVAGVGAVAAFALLNLRPGLPASSDDRAAAAVPPVATAPGPGQPTTGPGSPTVTITTINGQVVTIGVTVYPVPTTTDGSIPTTAGWPTTGPPPPTTGPPPPTTGPPPTTSGAVTFWSDGGTIVAICSGNLATITSWSPAPGYHAGMIKPGPAVEASVRFMQGSTQIKMSVTCPAGAPIVSIQDGRPTVPTP